MGIRVAAIIAFTLTWRLPCSRTECYRQRFSRAPFTTHAATSRSVSCERFSCALRNTCGGSRGRGVGGFTYHSQLMWRLRKMFFGTLTTLYPAYRYPQVHLRIWVAAIIVAFTPRNASASAPFQVAMARGISLTNRRTQGRTTRKPKWLIL